MAQRRGEEVKQTVYQICGRHDLGGGRLLMMLGVRRTVFVYCQVTGRYVERLVGPKLCCCWVDSFCMMQPLP